MSKRCALLFGQFGVIADPYNLPHLRDRLVSAGFETILVEHTDTQKVYDFLHGFKGFAAILGSSLGAGAAPIEAGYLSPQVVDFVGGFQPSDWDPVMHTDSVTMLRTVNVPVNVKEAMVFRNPLVAATGGLGHATYKTQGLTTKLTVIERPDPHPGDMPPAQDIMFNKIVELAGEGIGA